MDYSESKANCQLYTGSLVDNELGNVCKRWLSCSFIYYLPEVKENEMLSVYTAWKHVEEGVTAPLILNLGFESGCSGSHPGCFTTSHLTIASPPTPFVHCVAVSVGPRSGLHSVQ